MKRSHPFVLLAGSLLAVIPLYGSCALQSEGQLCTVDEDCAAGLTCTTPGGTTHAPLTPGVCCASGSTNPACANTNTTSGTTTSSSSSSSSTSVGTGGGGGSGGATGGGGAG